MRFLGTRPRNTTFAVVTLCAVLSLLLVSMAHAGESETAIASSARVSGPGNETTNSTQHAQLVAEEDGQIWAYETSEKLSYLPPKVSGLYTYRS